MMQEYISEEEESGLETEENQSFEEEYEENQ